MVSMAFWKCAIVSSGAVSPVDPASCRYGGVGNPIPLELLQRARLHAQRLRPLRGLCGAIDQPILQAEARELGSQRKPGRAGADDQYLRR